MNALVSLAPRNLDEAMRFADMVANSDLAPAQYKGKPGNVLVAVQMGAEVGLSPMQALQNISVINGRPSVWGDAAIGLVRGSAVCEDVIETIKGEGDAAVATCECRRKGAQPVMRTFSVADAKKANLWGKAGPWQQYPMRMLAQRARGFALRDAFPDVLKGIITTEEARDIPRDAIDVTPKEAAQQIMSQVDEWRRDRETQPAGPPLDLMTKGEDAAVHGPAKFQAFWKSLDKAERGILGGMNSEIVTRWRTIAADVDKASSDDLTEQPADNGVEPTPPQAEPQEDAFGLPPLSDDEAFCANILSAVAQCTTLKAIDEVKRGWEAGGQFGAHMKRLPEPMWLSLMGKIGEHEKSLQREVAA